MNKKEWNDWLLSIWSVLQSKLPAEDEKKNAILRAMVGWDYTVGMSRETFRDLEIFKVKDEKIEFQNTMNFYKVKPLRGNWAKLTAAQKTLIETFRSEMDKSNIAKYLDDKYPEFFSLVKRKNGERYDNGKDWLKTMDICHRDTAIFDLSISLRKVSLGSSEPQSTLLSTL